MAYLGAIKILQNYLRQPPKADSASENPVISHPSCGFCSRRARTGSLSLRDSSLSPIAVGSRSARGFHTSRSVDTGFEAKDRIFRLGTTQILIIGFSKRPHVWSYIRHTTLFPRVNANDNEEILHEQSGNSFSLGPRCTDHCQAGVAGPRCHLGTPRRSGARWTVFDGRPSCVAFVRCSHGARLVFQIMSSIF